MTQMGRCCRCGKPIEWGVLTDKHGKIARIPLDPRPPVYMMAVVASDGLPDTVVRWRGGRLSHLATCRTPEQSRKRKEKNNRER